MTALPAGVASSSPGEKEQKVRFWLFHNPSYLYLMETVDCLHSYSYSTLSCPKHHVSNFLDLIDKIKRNIILWDYPLVSFDVIDL